MSSIIRSNIQGQYTKRAWAAAPLRATLSVAMPVDFCGLTFDNSFVRALPADPLLLNEPRQVLQACYTRVDPSPVRAPALLGWAAAVGDLLGAATPESPDGPAAQVLGGNRVLPGMEPYAARYG